MEIFWNSFKKNWSSGQGDNIHYFKWRTVVTYVMNFSFFFLISSVSKNISTFPKKASNRISNPKLRFQKKKTPNCGFNFKSINVFAFVIGIDVGVEYRCLLVSSDRHIRFVNIKLQNNGDVRTIFSIFS
jgi:hypothetical protein